MNILVTGGSGEVGRAAVRRLVAEGNRIRVIGRRGEADAPGAEYRSCDINDGEDLRRQMEGVEAVVHLAAITHPGGGPGPEIFRVNCQGSFNVYQCAADLGIRRVISASSINAFGYNFGVRDFPIRYFPVDEEHPPHTTDAYSFSKQMLEEIAAYFWRRDRISGVCLRLPYVYNLDGPRGRRNLENLRATRTPVSDLLALTEDARRNRVARVWRVVDDIRAHRANEHREVLRDYDREDLLLAYGATNFWTHIDADDSAQAIAAAVAADYEGSHPLYVNGGFNFVGVPSESLLELFFPRVPRRNGPVPGSRSLVSIDRARNLIGFAPCHTGEEWLTEPDRQ